MSLFGRLVDEALANQAELAPLRPVVEKELLHHDILREMSHAGLLMDLTFIGGTCLRTCYGSNRLSEDLDFTAGTTFRREVLSGLAACLAIAEYVKQAYGMYACNGILFNDKKRRDNPTLKTLLAVLKTVGLRLSVEPENHVHA